MASGDEHTMRVPDWIWEWAKKRSGAVRPATFLRDTLAQAVIDNYEQIAQYPIWKSQVPEGFEICLLDETCQYHLRHKVVHGKWVGTPKT